METPVAPPQDPLPDRDTLDSVGLASRLYDELRDIARREFGRERSGHTLQPTALANEAYLRLVQQTEQPFRSRSHFMAAAARTVRRVLVDHARRRSTLKRGSGLPVADPGEFAWDPQAPDPDDWVALDSALERLAAYSPLKSRIVELRFFAGMENAEMARVLDLSLSTVRREWRVARAWLRTELEDRDDS